jgi:hypothetical protein
MVSFPNIFQNKVGISIHRKSQLHLKIERPWEREQEKRCRSKMLRLMKEKPPPEGCEDPEHHWTQSSKVSRMKNAP